MTNATVHTTADVVVALKRETYPNFDFIRLVAASSVVFSHAFLIGEGDDTREPLVRLLGTHQIIGIYGVHCFFVISGFLVTQSLAESASLRSFLWRRFLRIYPALLACLFLSAFVLGPFFSTQGVLNFFSTSAGPSYFFRNLLWPGREWSMAAVRFYPEPSGWLGIMINGSLWTIFHELACYCFIAVLAAVGMLRAWTIGFLAVLLAAAAILGAGAQSRTITDFLSVAPGFFAGATLCLMAIQKVRSPRITLVVTVVSILVNFVAWRLGVLSKVFPVAGAAPILLLATSTRMRLPRLDQIGDVSYGTYLYGWPVEQTVRSLIGAQAGWLPVFAIALPVAYILGFASWWILEKPAMRYKR